MRGGEGKLDKRYLAVAGGLIIVAVAASLYFFPEWRQSPALMIVLIISAVVGVVIFADAFRGAFIRDKTPAPPAALDYDSPQHRRNQENVTANVRTAWIDGVLRESLPERVRIELALDSLPGLLQRTMITAEGQEPRREPVSGEHIADLFRASGRALLILGAPGSGKTLTLLELCRPILEGAEADPRRPVPVVLNLSTWAQKRAPLEEWIGDEMWRQYGLNRQVTPVWLAADHLILLLDGLDEVAKDAGDACVRAINTFRENYGAGMTVCSRSADYAGLRERLALSRAVEILPLTPAQTDAYLGNERLALAAVREAIARDDALRELATTPLMLNVMAVAYGGRPFAELLPLLESENERRAHLYDAYLARMFRRKPIAGVNYTAAQALDWLRFIAARLTERDETQFFIEDLQPDWLPGRRGLLIRSINVILGGLAGALIGATIGMMGFSNYLLNNLYSMLIGMVGIDQAVIWGNALIGLGVGSFYGMMFGGGDVDSIDELETDFSPGNIRRALKNGVLVAVPLSVLLGVLGGVLGSVLGSILGGVLLGVLGGELGGVLVGVLLGVLLGVLGGVLLGLVRRSQSKRRDRPNQGIRRSAANALRGGVLFGVLLGGLGNVLVGVLFGSLFGVLLGVLAGVLFGGLLGGLLYGGAAVIKHYLLRLLLSVHRLLPLRLVPFLEAMRERILVQRAGGHYRFIHRTFQEHLAGLTGERLAAIVAEGAPASTSEVF